MADTETAARVARDFFSLGPLERVAVLSGGRVNRTFLVEAGSGRYVLQRLHPVFGPDGAAAVNAYRVGEALCRAGLPAPRVIPAGDGRAFAEHEGIWRLSTHLPGQTVSCLDPASAAGCGRLLGAFHRALGREPVLLEPLPAADYNREGPWPLADWEGLVRERLGHEKFPAVKDDLREGMGLTASLPGIPLKTRGIVHGDPKGANFLFGEAGVSGVIDLDTVRPGAYLWDLADGLRSWTGRLDEKGCLAPDRRIFEAAAQAYRESGPKLDPAEWEALPPAVAAIALNLALRFFRDYFDETYFAWDRERFGSLALQNRTLGRRMTGLARGLLSPAS